MYHHVLVTRYPRDTLILLQEVLFRSRKHSLCETILDWNIAVKKFSSGGCFSSLFEANKVVAIGKPVYFLVHR